MGHSFMYRTLVGLATRAELRRQGYRFLQIQEMMAAYDDDLIATAEVQSGAKFVPPMEGDRPILDAILEFLRSDLGKMLIKTIVSLLISLLF